VYRRDYYAKDSTWTYLGETPLDSVRIPFSFSRIKVEKDNYQTVYDATNSAQLSYRDYLLDSVGTIPKNIVHIPSITISINLPYLTNLESAEIKDFLIDKYEVTNKEYKIFVDSGGYQKKQYWNHLFVKNGRIITLEVAMSIFVDKTGRPGPSTWEGGNSLCRIYREITANLLSLEEGSRF
jgi:hypothetical protein